MAKCKECGLEMLEADGCTVFRVKFGKKIYLRLKFSTAESEDGDGCALESNQRCHDCGCKVREFHHPGCDMERCPRCRDQIISCNCP